MQSSDLKQAASDAAGRSRSFLSAQLGERSSVVGKSIASTAGDLRRIAGDLQQSETVGGSAVLANRGADALDRVARYLCDSDGDQLIADIEDFTRRQPWVVAVAALTAGFATSRVLKASSSRRYQSAYGQGAAYGRSASSYAY